MTMVDLDRTFDITVAVCDSILHTNGDTTTAAAATVAADIISLREGFKKNKQRI